MRTHRRTTRGQAENRFSRTSRSAIAGAVVATAVFGIGSLQTVAAGTQTAIPKGTDEAPYGYLQFLPTHFSTSTGKLPLVVFFHGKSEGGDGVEPLLTAKLIAHGPPKILQDSNRADPIYQLIDSKQAIVLSPQFPVDPTLKDGAWWTGAGIKDFFFYLFTKSRISPRIDMSRIYLTGLSAGAAGIYDYMNTQAQANRKTAVLVAAPRSVKTTNITLNAYGMGAAAHTKFWALTAYGDSSSSATGAVDRIADYIGGNGGGVMAQPGFFQVDANGNKIAPTMTKTALYSAATRWFWTNGLDATTAYHPKLTLYPGRAHDTWTQTYNNPNVWNWLFAQQRVVADTTSPTVTITHPTTASTFTTTASTIGLAGTATDNVAVHKLTYSNAANGRIGVLSGTSNWSKATPLDLAIGANVITITARDTSGNPVSKTITITRR